MYSFSNANISAARVSVGLGVEGLEVPGEAAALGIVGDATLEEVGVVILEVVGVVTLEVAGVVALEVAGVVVLEVAGVVALEVMLLGDSQM